MTALDNLESIVQYGLLSRRDLLQRGLLKYDVANPDILDQRGELSKLVPFHFLTRNPFDYGVVRSKQHEGKRFIYLAVKRTYARDNGWKIIPKHPLADSEDFELLNWNDGIAAVDWHQLDKRGSWDTDHDCKQACMAEALSPGAVAFSVFSAFFCSERRRLPTCDSSAS